MDVDLALQPVAVVRVLVDVRRWRGRARTSARQAGALAAPMRLGTAARRSP